MSIWPNWKNEKIFAVTITVLLVSSIIYLGIKTDNLLRQTEEIGEPVPYEHSIVVEGEGTVIGKPDIATLVFGTETLGENVASAQAVNTETMNSIIEKIKTLGVSDDDIQTTGYNVYEDTNWDPETYDYKSAGWIVNNYINVKVRDTSKISSLLAMTGTDGITNISGPTFTIDDTTNLKAEARELAIAQSQEKARGIAAALGMRLEKVIGYSEWSPSSNLYPAYDSYVGLGSGGPTVESGTSEVTISVSVTYKLVE